MLFINKSWFIKYQNSKATNVNNMFYECRSLKKNNVITQDEKIIKELDKLGV